MKLRTNLSRLLRRFIRREDAAVAPIVAVMLPVMFGMLGLVEAGRVYNVKNQLQATADAAAMASVHDVPVLADVRVTANEFAQLNMPQPKYGDVLIDSNVVTGNWDGVGFTQGVAPTNAVRVTTSDVMPLFFAAALNSLGVGVPASFTPSAQATALLRPDKCYSNGFVAGGIIKMNSSNTFAAKFCVYGLGGVTMNNSNIFEAGTGVGMANLANLSEGGNNPGLDDAKYQNDVAPPALGEAQHLIDELLAGSGPMGMPVTIASWPPAVIVPGTLYHVTGAVDIQLGGGLLQDVGIVSDISITVKSNSNLRSVTLASPGPVNINSNVVFGDADFCATGDGKSLIISGGHVTGKEAPLGTNSNITLYGVQMVSEGPIVMNSNLTIIGASVQSTADITFNSQFAVSGCLDETSPNVTGGGTMVSQLVD